MSHSLASTLVRIRLMLPADIFGSSDLTTLSLVFLLEIDLFQSKGQEILEGQVEADEQELCHHRH